MIDFETYLLRYRQERRYEIVGKLIFLSFDDIFGKDQGNNDFKFEFMKFKYHLYDILKTKDVLQSFKSLIESDAFFKSPLELLSHIDLKHQHLPVGVFTDVIAQTTTIPLVIKSPRHSFQKGIVGVKNLLHNVYRDLTALKPLDCAFTTDTKCKNLERNQALLVYAYVTLALQLQDHIDQPKTPTNSKMVVLHAYLENYIYVLQQDFFEVASNNECLTESDRIAFGKFNILKIIAGLLIKK